MAGRLREQLAGAGLGAYADAICGQLDVLYAQRDDRSLTASLKEAGIIKLGHRQKAAALIRSLHGAATDASASAPDATSPAGASNDFWSGIAASSLESTAVGTLDACDARFALSEAPETLRPRRPPEAPNLQQPRSEPAGCGSGGGASCGTTDGGAQGQRVPLPSMCITKH